MTLQGFGGPPQYLRIAADRLLHAPRSPARPCWPRCSCASAPAAASACETSLLQGGAGAAVRAAWWTIPAGTTVYPRQPHLSPLPGQRRRVVLPRRRQPVVLGEALHRPSASRGLADDPRFGSWLARRGQRRGADAACSRRRFGSKPRAEWLRILAAHDIPAARDPDHPGVHATTRRCCTTRWSSSTTTRSVGPLAPHGPAAPLLRDAGRATRARRRPSASTPTRCCARPATPTPRSPTFAGAACVAGKAARGSRIAMTYVRRIRYEHGRRRGHHHPQPARRPQRDERGHARASCSTSSRGWPRTTTCA